MLKCSLKAILYLLLSLKQRGNSLDAYISTIPILSFQGNVETQREADGERYISEILAKATQDIKNQKKAIMGASKAYNILRTTLRRHLSNQIKGLKSSD